VDASEPPGPGGLHLGARDYGIIARVLIPSAALENVAAHKLPPPIIGVTARV
jgi:hypothetical protein